MEENYKGEVEFKEFPKIPRFSRDVIISEKIDGTNGLVFVNEERTVVKAGSRSQWITPEKDNYGFAKWVQQHQEELLELGPGYHYGEWWGNGIQRGYNQSTKKFSLFNVERWHVDGKKYEGRPPCCDVVPIMHRGSFDTAFINGVLERLEKLGSAASPGFMKPEGIVIYHTAGNLMFKKTMEKDEEYKGKQG